MQQEEDGNHGNIDNGNEGTSQNDREENREKEEDSTKGEGERECEGEQDDKEPMETEKEVDLFTLSAVNAYGSQEVRKIEDEPNKFYTLTSKSMHLTPSLCHLHIAQWCVMRTATYRLTAQ